jgi:16S rRNA (guanine527-N7)-methyltransferase
MSSIVPPELTAEQRDKLIELTSLAQTFNAKINLYSEASTRDFWTRHIMHSLMLAGKPFPPGARVVDWGTGGGMPGLPLAILFPNVEFILVDAVQKKIRAVQAMARRLSLNNVTAWHGRAEAWEGTATHSVSRATAPISVLWAWHEKNTMNSSPSRDDAAWRPGLLCLKGGDLTSEISDLNGSDPNVVTIVTPLDKINAGVGFTDKALVEVYRR